MKKMKSGKVSERVLEEKVAETSTVETADDELVSIAEAIKKESTVPKSAVKASKSTEAGLFEGLLKKLPTGRLNLGIAVFVRKHFKQISFVRDKSYSWKQIAEVVQNHLQGQSRNLPRSLSDAFFRERHRGEF